MTDLATPLVLEGEEVIISSTATRRASTCKVLGDWRGAGTRHNLLIEQQALHRVERVERPRAVLGGDAGAGSHRTAVNLPRRLASDSLADAEDLDDLAFALDIRVDFVALSSVPAPPPTSASCGAGYRGGGSPAT